MRIQVKGLSLNMGQDDRLPFRKLASADIRLPELGVTINKVTLSWTPEGGFRALAPWARVAGDRILSWSSEGEFARMLCEEIVAAYKRSGAVLPDAQEKPIFIPIGELDVSEDESVPLRDRVQEAIQAAHESTGKMVFTELYEARRDAA